MLLLGCKPPGRHTEQHDIFFGIGNSLRELVVDILAFWPEANGRIHIDAYREVRMVDGHAISVVPKNTAGVGEDSLKLFFVNLGGYKENDFEEYHYKLLVVAPNMAGAIQSAKEQAFWKHSLSAHVDDKYGIDVDDIYEVEDILVPRFRESYRLDIRFTNQRNEDALHPGYLKLSKLTES